MANGTKLQPQMARNGRLRWLVRVMATFWFELLVAVAAPTLFSRLVYYVWHPKAISAADLVAREFAISAVVAFVLGIIISYCEPHSVSFWIWTIPLAWFVFGVLILTPYHVGSVLSGRGLLPYARHVWLFFTVGNGSYPFEIFAFTVPLIRGCAFSLGAAAQSCADFWLRRRSPARINLAQE